MRSPSYTDNEATLLVLDGAPNGIFHLLDTSCAVRTGAAAFCLEVHRHHGDALGLAESHKGSAAGKGAAVVLSPRGRHCDSAFIVRHFAGEVFYQVSLGASLNHPS